MLEIKDVINLIGGELKDSSEETKRFREFIEKDRWTTEQIKNWLDECVNTGSGPHDPYNRAFQDLVISIGKKLGFEIEYGRYIGKASENNYDGLWRRENGDTLVLEAKTTTWPIGSIGQLGDYIEKLGQKAEDVKIFALYVIGKGDIQPLLEQIMGSKFKNIMRLIMYDDLIELLTLREELEPVVGKKESINKIQNILLPIESINLGNIIKLIIEIATKKSVSEGASVEGGGVEEGEGDINEPWTKNELVPYIEASTPYQRLLLGTLTQIDKEPSPMKNVTFLMNEIAKRRQSEGIAKKITGRELAGARAGLKMRRTRLKKEDIIECSWSSSEHDYIYNIKNDYKELITDWVKKENLWIKEELE
jgi:hypothetical protein